MLMTAISVDAATHATAELPAAADPIVTDHRDLTSAAPAAVDTPDTTEAPAAVDTPGTTEAPDAADAADTADTADAPSGTRRREDVTLSRVDDPAGLRAAPNLPQRRLGLPVAAMTGQDLIDEIERTAHLRGDQ